MPLSQLSGGEEILQKILQNHSWVMVMESALVFFSFLLNLGLFSWLMANRKILLISRLPTPPWIFGEGIQLMALYAFVFFGIFLLTSLVNQGFGQALNKAGYSELHLMAANVSLTHLIALGLMLDFFRRLKTTTGASLFSYWQIFRADRAIWGVVLFLAVLMPVTSVTALTQFFFDRIGWPFELQPLVSMLQKTHETWFVIIFTVFAVILAPVVEEAFFRGILYPTLRRRWGFGPALFVNSLLFALMHFHFPSLLPLFCLALFFTFAFEITGSLSVCIIAHSLFNGMGIGMIWFIRGLQ